jgi:hypothetical protein
MSINDVYLQLVELKNQFDQLISNLESDAADNVEQDDDLPF